LAQVGIYWNHQVCCVVVGEFTLILTGCFFISEAGNGIRVATNQDDRFSNPEAS